MDLRQTRPETQKRKKKMLWKVFEKKKFSTHLGSKKKNRLYKTLLFSS
jgi:hypothetical protein